MKKAMRVFALIGFMVFFFSAAMVGAQTGPIKIGVNSAWDYPGGQGVKRGGELAIRELNAAGGLLGRKVEGIFYDNKVDPNEAKNATERLLYKDKVDVILGFWRSDLAIVGQPLVMEAKKILLIGGATTPVITHERIRKDYKTYKYTFNLAGTTFATMISMEQGVIEAQKSGLNKIALLVEKAAWCDPLYDDWMKKYAGKVVYSTRFSTTATDFSVEFSQVKASGADILAFITTGRGGTPSVKQWWDMKIPAVYVGYNVDAQDPNFWQVTEGKAQGVATSTVGGVAGWDTTPKSRPFLEAYKKAFGEYPIAYTNGISYDSVMVWAHAVKLARTMETEAVLKVMERKDLNYEGVCGFLEYFDEIHCPVGGGWAQGEPWGWVAYQWRDGERVSFWPKRFAAGKLIIPDWVKNLQKK